MKAFTWIVVAAVVVIAGLAIFGNGTNRDGLALLGRGESLKIGLLVPLTGEAARYGESINAATQIAMERINAVGGVGGKNIEFVIEDGKCESEAARAAAQKLVNVDRVAVIVGGACSEETLAAAEIAEPARVILISPAASSPKVGTAGDFVFRTYPSETLSAKAAARYAAETLAAKRAALITERSDYGTELREAFTAAFAAAGGTSAADETYAVDATDFKSQIANVNKAKPDTIYVAGKTLAPALAAIRELRKTKITANIIVSETLLEQTIAEENRDALEGVIVIASAVDWNGNPRANELREAHRAKFGGADPGQFAANAYDAVYLIREAIAASGLDAEKIRDFLYMVKDWDGAAGKLTMDANGDPIMGLNIRQIAGGEVMDKGTYQP